MKLFTGSGYDSTIYCWHDDADKALDVMAEHLAYQHDADIATCREAIEVAWVASHKLEEPISMLLGREHGTCLITIP